jgi:hypothetical protein
MPPRSGKKGRAEKRSFRCTRCNRAVRIPAGWDLGSGVRRHYWRAHRDVMQPGLGRETE